MSPNSQRARRGGKAGRAAKPSRRSPSRRSPSRGSPRRPSCGPGEHRGARAGLAGLQAGALRWYREPRSYGHLRRAPPSAVSPERQALLRAIPAVDRLLAHPLVVEVAQRTPRWIVVDAVREVLDRTRAPITVGKVREAPRIDDLAAAVCARAGGAREARDKKSDQRDGRGDSHQSGTIGAARGRDRGGRGSRAVVLVWSSISSAARGPRGPRRSTAWSRGSSARKTASW